MMGGRPRFGGPNAIAVPRPRGTPKNKPAGRGSSDVAIGRKSLDMAGPRNPTPGTRSPELGPRNSVPGTRSPELGPRNSAPGTRSPELGARSHAPDNKADRVGFEPTLPRRANRFSRPARSAAPPPVRSGSGGIVARPLGSVKALSRGAAKLSRREARIRRGSLRHGRHGLVHYERRDTDEHDAEV